MIARAFAIPLAIPILELKNSWKRPLHWIMLVAFGLMSFGFVAGGVQISTGSADTGGAKVERRAEVCEGARECSGAGRPHTRGQ